MKAVKYLGLGACLIILVGAGYLGYFLKQVAPFASGFAAHTFCSNLFIAKRQFEDIEQFDLPTEQQLLTRSRVDGNTVTTDFGIWPINYTSVSVYRPGLGCGQLAGGNLKDLEGPASIERVLPGRPSNALAWPELNTTGVNTKRLNDVLDRAFSDTATSYEDRKNTRAVVIFHRDQLIAERYAEGFDSTTPQNSWSMTKSATSALIGILVRDGRLNLEDPAPIREWQNPDDTRRQVTTEDLLFMVSGLEFNEGYENDPISDVNRMLMNSRDLASFAASFPVTAEPGTRWAYQTASSVLLGRVIRETLTDDDAYYHFAQQELFQRLGARHSHYQADGAGSYVGGAFLYATPRDWARFGLLYLNDGVFAGLRILPEGWVAYSTTPTPASLEARAYGAQFWLNTRGGNQWMPAVPADAYAARGHYGQTVIIIPSRALVVVRMGQTFNPGAWDTEAFLVELLDALPRN
jgi:CubicO group peptidase (beta-lactamase class C family)